MEICVYIIYIDPPQCKKKRNAWTEWLGPYIGNVRFTTVLGSTEF